MQDGVFRQRLEHHFRHKAVFQLRRDLHGEGEAVGQPDALDLHIALQNLHLLPQGNEFLRPDAEAQNIGEVRGHQRDLRHLIDLADPLHGVEGVAEKMRVELCL